MEIKSKCCNSANMGGTRGMAAVDWIVIHYTSNLGDTAKNNADYFAREALKDPASAHYFVDESEVWSSVPIYRIAYHCGSKTYKHPRCRNTNSIGVEICMLDKSACIRMDAIRHAAELVRWLMNEYGIDREHVIRHYDVTGKYCPGPMVDDPDLWERFMDMLTEESEDKEMKTYQYVKDMPDWAQASVTKAIQKGIVAMDANGAVAVLECNLQPLVWMDRAGMLDK